jgi:hypothetical protein
VTTIQARAIIGLLSAILAIAVIAGGIAWNNHRQDQAEQREQEEEQRIDLAQDLCELNPALC